jgi:basic membrane protein A
LFPAVGLVSLLGITDLFFPNSMEENGMHKKLSLFLALLIITTSILVACQAPTLTEADCPKSDVLCVGLVTGLDGIDDRSFNQSAWEGILMAKTENVADWVQYIETVDSKDYQTNITKFADAGYDVILTVGDVTAEATSSAARSFPAILYIAVDQNQVDVLPNLVGLVFHDDQSGFLAGALAALMSKTGTIAGVFGTNQVPRMVAFAEGYSAGARYINPNINILSTLHPGALDMAFNDPEWGAATAAQAIQNGADVVFGFGGKTGNGALIKTASFPGLYCIGTDIDQWETIPVAHPCLLSSAMKLINTGVVSLVKAAHDGTFPSGNFYGAVGLAPFHDFDSTIPQAVKDKIYQVDAGLKDGSITTGYDPGK